MPPFLLPYAPFAGAANSSVLLMYTICVPEPFIAISLHCRYKMRRIKRKAVSTLAATSTSASRLSVDTWAVILSKLDRDDKISAACTCRFLAAASSLLTCKMAIDVSERVGVREFPPWLREVMLVYGEKPSSLINILRSIDEAACESGVTLAASRRSVCLVAAALRRLVKAQTSPRAAATPCGLTLTLAIPEMTVPLKKLQVLLERLGSSSLFSEVKVAKGLAMLDGALQWKLSQAAVLGENVLSWIKVIRTVTSFLSNLISC